MQYRLLSAIWEERLNVCSVSTVQLYEDIEDYHVSLNPEQLLACSFVVSLRREFGSEFLPIPAKRWSSGGNGLRLGG